MDFLLNKVENQRKLLGQDLWPKPLQITIIGDGDGDGDGDELLIS